MNRYARPSNQCKGHRFVFSSGSVPRTGLRKAGGLRAYHVPSKFEMCFRSVQSMINKSSVQTADRKPYTAQGRRSLRKPSRGQSRCSLSNQPARSLPHRLRPQAWPFPYNTKPIKRTEMHRKSVGVSTKEVTCNPPKESRKMPSV